jgi:hypothetical protein
MLQTRKIKQWLAEGAVTLFLDDAVNGTVREFDSQEVIKNLDLIMQSGTGDLDSIIVSPK